MSHSVRVRIQGREYNLRSQQDSGQVQSVVAFIEGRLAEVAQAGSVDSQDALALCLLNLAAQYLALRDATSPVDPQQDERVAQLLHKIESALA